MEMDLHLVPLLIRIIVNPIQYPVSPHLCLVEDKRSFGKTVFHSQLVLRVDMKDHTIVGQVWVCGMPECPFTTELWERPHTIR